MKRLVSIQLSGIGECAGKALLTAAVVVVLLLVLGLVGRVHALFLASHAQTAPQIYVNGAAHSQSRNADIHPFWPEFPRNSTANIHAAVVNGVQLVTEEWECTASPTDVLSYYQEQMMARNWRDVTEATYNLQPELHDFADDPQDERFAHNYRNIMESRLVLSRGKWSMHVTAEPGKTPLRKTAVKIYAAATPSITAFVEEMGSAIAGGGGQSGKPLDAVQQHGRERYHTTVVVRNEPQELAFQESLANLESKGWKPMVVLPRQQGRSGFSVWLTKGGSYAALSVNGLPQGRGTSVTLTQVTPD